MFVGVTGIFVIILLIVTSSGCTGDIKKSSPEPEVKIIHPDEKVNWQESIGGTAKNIPDGYQLWVLVYSKDKDQYYPINKTMPNKYNEWTTPVTIGLEDDYGENFDIVAVVANKEAQNKFSDYLKNNTDNLYSQGTFNIDGSKECDRMTVTRKPLISLSDLF